jgi:hypothetical protein
LRQPRANAPVAGASGGPSGSDIGHPPSDGYRQSPPPVYYGAHLPLDGGAAVAYAMILAGPVASIAFGTLDPIHDR